MERPIYLDHNATTPVAPEVVEAMLPALRDLWGNPSSAHAYGVAARQAIETARSQVASLLGCRPDEVVFTSGGTESDNAAVLGVAHAFAGRGRHLVLSNVEHPAVDAAAAWLETRGFEVTRVQVDGNGRLDPADVEAALRTDTVLVSIMHANNETGVVLPVAEIGRITRARGIPLHTDAAQSAGKLAVKLDDLEADLITIAGHKLYAPKGVGALVIRRGTPFAPFLRGAAHESGRRAGTEATPAIVGLGAACALAAAEGDERARRMRRTRDRIAAGLRERLGEIVVHGEDAERLPNTLSVAIPGVDAQRLLARLDGVATAAGAACHAGRAEPSRVLRAMGVSDALALATLRLTTGRGTTDGEADLAAERIAAAAARARLGSR